MRELLVRAHVVAHDFGAFRRVVHGAKVLGQIRPVRAPAGRLHVELLEQRAGRIEFPDVRGTVDLPRVDHVSYRVVHA